MLLSFGQAWAALLATSALITSSTGVVARPGPSDSSLSLSRRSLQARGLERLEIKRGSRPPRATSTSDHPIQTAYFDQLLDHGNPSAGTFKQRYFFSDAYYQGSGSPIVFMNPGEQSAEGFDSELGSGSLQNALMVEMGGAGVVLEHRYWGKSSPYSVLSTANLTYLTLDQSIEDHKYFVENVKLPWTDKSLKVDTTPSGTPWVQIGCSYPGLLSAYIQQQYPTLFAASWASSAPVQADSDFWEYFKPVEEGMPKNCSSDLGLAIDYVDAVLSNGTASDKQALKSYFGLDSLQDDDFAYALSTPLFNWQSMQPWSYEQKDDSMAFYQFCDYIETDKDGHQSMDPKGVGQELAVRNLAAWFASIGAAGGSCAKGACFNSYDYTNSYYTDLSVENQADRQWLWMVCSEFGWFQTGDPGNGSRIVSKFVTEAYNERQCNHQFPHADGTAGSYDPNVENINLEHNGWNIQADNLIVVNGQYDPWRSASVSSEYDPTANVNTTGQIIYVVQGGHHCWDFSLSDAQYNPSSEQIMSLGISQVKTWVQQWYNSHPSVQHHTFASKTLGTLNNPSTDKTSGVDVSNNPAGTDATTPGQDSTSNTTVTPTEAASTSGNSSNGIVGNKALVYTSLALNAALILGALIAAIIFFFVGKKKNKIPAGRTDIGPYYGGAGVEDSEYKGAGKGPGGRGQYQTVSHNDS